MKFTYENQGSYSYLVYEVQPDDDVDTLSLGMITNNKIAGLATVLYTQMDDKKYIKYNISAKVSTAQFFEGIVNKKQLLSIFSSIVSALIVAEEYMIDVNSFVLDMNYLYTDVTSYETVLICLPITDMSKRPIDYSSFFKNIMFRSKFDQTENYDYIARIINYLNSTANFSLADFRKLLMELSGNISQMPSVSVPPTMVLQTPPQMVSPIQGNSMTSAETSLSEGMLDANRKQSAEKQNFGKVEGNTESRRAEVGKNSIGAGNSGIAIPGNSPKKQEISVSNPANSNMGQKNENEKKITMFNLLSHYNKENAALYKEQKQREKEQKIAEKNLAEGVKKKKEKTKPAKVNKKAVKNTQFSVPGQQSNITAAGQQNGIRVPNSQSAGNPMQQQGFMQQSFAGDNNHSQQFAQNPALASAAGNGNFQMAGNYNQGMNISRNSSQGMSNVNVMQQPTGNVLGGLQTATDQRMQGSSSFGETTVLNSNFGDTVVLTNEMQKVQMQPYLLRIKNNERILLNKPIFRIGKEKSYVDYFIGDNAAISRSHANIIVKENGCFIVDTNSTNHTYVNGRMIQSNLEAPIASGDKITLANEEFEMCYSS